MGKQTRPLREDQLGARIRDALLAACHPRGHGATSVMAMGAVGVLYVPSLATRAVETDAEEWAIDDVDALVVRLFETEGHSLVRLARLFVDDRNAAEDLVQEAFIKLSRSAHRINDPAKAPAYLRSIVLNLARDHNRRGLMSLRHQLPFDDARSGIEDEIELREDQSQVIDALRELPPRQRDCLVLRYYQELGIAEIAETLRISQNSVKTHLKRGLRALERALPAEETASVGEQAS